MRLSRILPVATLAGAAASAVAVGLVSVPRAQADTRITVPGAGPLYQPNFYTSIPGLGGNNYFVGESQLLGISQHGLGSLSILQAYDLLNHEIGENWFPGSTAQVVDYPASAGIIVSGGLAAPGTNDAVAMGQQALNDQIMNAVVNGNGSPVNIAALSEGTIVVDRELAYLATDPNAPSASDLHFVMFSNPELGLADTYLPAGTTVPVIDYTAQDMPNTQYDVSMVSAQYDIFGDPPDRPWNLLADLDALFGFHYYHTPAALASPSDAVELSSVTDSLGGTITTYMIPASILPMLLPLEQLGVPKKIIDDLNSMLKPIVDQGYSSLTPDAGPYFSHGELLGLPSLADVPAATGAEIAPVDLAGLL